MKALDFLRQAMCAVLHRRTAMAIENKAGMNVRLFVVAAFLDWHNHS
jgi:hypothetical protein